MKGAITKARKWIQNNLKLTVLIAYILCLVLINFTKARFEMDMIILSILVLALLIGKGKQFVKDWSIPMFLFWFYEYSRGLAHDFAVRFNRPLLMEELVNVERKLFFFMKDIPTVVWQYAWHVEGVTQWYDIVLFLFYTSFFWVWMGIGFFIWKFKKERFKDYIYGLLGFSLFDNIIYALWPSAPPWYAAQQGVLPPLNRVMWLTEAWNKANISAISLLDDNPFAAFPSHHVGWTFYAALFLTVIFGKKALPMFIFPIMILIAVVYGAEHYVIDGIVGSLFGAITVIILQILYKRRKKKKAMD